MNKQTKHIFCLLFVLLAHPLILDDDEYKKNHPDWISDLDGPIGETPIFSHPYHFIPSLIIKTHYTP